MACWFEQNPVHACIQIIICSCIYTHNLHYIFNSSIQKSSIKCMVGMMARCPREE